MRRSYKPTRRWTWQDTHKCLRRRMLPARQVSDTSPLFDALLGNDIEAWRRDMEACRAKPE